MRVRALETLNARLGFGRPTVDDIGSGIARAGTSKRAIGVLTPANAISAPLVGDAIVDQYRSDRGITLRSGSAVLPGLLVS